MLIHECISDRSNPSEPAVSKHRVSSINCSLVVTDAAEIREVVAVGLVPAEGLAVVDLVAELDSEARWEGEFE